MTTTLFKSLLVLMISILSTSPAFALHAYANYSCENETLSLEYDGPGSNYAYGGFSHFYSKAEVNAEKERVLAQSATGEDAQEKIGDDVSDEKLDVLFQFGHSKKTSKVVKDVHAGDKCTPDEWDYVTYEWTSEDSVEITDSSAVAVAKLGLSKGTVLKFKCKNSSSTPIRCPKSGAYSADFND